MKKLIITSLIVFQLIAQTITSSENPAVYSALGDVIYNNVNNIEKLQSIEEYEKNKIKKYIKDVENIKKIGFKIQNGDENIDKAEYLKYLRKLSAINDYYVDSINNNFKEAVKNENNDLFLINIKTGLLPINKNKEIIIEYYYKHQSDINITDTIIKDILDEKNKKASYKSLSKTDLKKMEIERIRKKDKIKQKAIERSLEEEVAEKKAKIRADQKQELGIKTK